MMKGWFLLCPVLVRESADRDFELEVRARWRCLEWWFTVNEYVWDWWAGLTGEERFPFIITGRGE